MLVQPSGHLLQYHRSQLLVTAFRVYTKGVSYSRIGLDQVHDLRNHCVESNSLHTLTAVWWSCMGSKATLLSYIQYWSRILSLNLDIHVQTDA